MKHAQVKQVAVLGAGSWGTALALLLSRNGLRVTLWGHEVEHVTNLRQDRENKAFLPGFVLPSLIDPVATLEAALIDTDEILIVVPSHAFHITLKHLALFVPNYMGISWATKGFEPSSNKLLHEIATDILGTNQNMAVISGPTFAREVASGLPTAVTVAATNLEYAQKVAGYLHSGSFRTYTTTDIVGVQVSGAAKNILAIAAGIADGLGFGANSRAALITRGLTELTRLGIAMGGDARTFVGLAGLGDLALTCTDNQSRNRRLGLLLAKNLNVVEACREIGQEVEGVGATKAVFYKAQEFGVEMPICEQVYHVLYDHISPLQAAQTLLERDKRREID
jgi:glycerol-3-phosphate dehydrogenase (NAD(P)+)